MTLYDYFHRDVKKISFFGLGRSNLALMNFLPLSSVRVTIRSDGEIDCGKIPPAIKPHAIYLGKDSCRHIDEDVILFSPSVRRERSALIKALRRGTLFTSDAELFFQNATGRVLAVSGSDGKSTTSAIAGALLRASSGAPVIGNIGEPMLPYTASDFSEYVVELSSFNLCYLKFAPSRAVLTNITPNHLNWHASFKEYRDTKLSLLESAKEPVVAFDDPEIRRWAIGRRVFAGVSTECPYSELKRVIRGELYITLEDGFVKRNGVPLIEIAQVKRNEPHNIKNLMSALALTDGYRSDEDAVGVASEFTGLPHRCEVFYTYGGVDFINSSIDTTPYRTSVTLQSLGRPMVVILGGRGKGLSYDVLLPLLKKYASYAVVTGEDGEKILAAIGGEVRTVMTHDLYSAVQTAIRLAQPGDAVLLSPAATSYDEFQSFEERGRCFEKIVKEYYENAEK